MRMRRCLSFMTIPTGTQPAVAMVRARRIWRNQQRHLRLTGRRTLLRLPLVHPLRGQMSFPLLGAAIVPGLLILWFFHSRDRNPEPRGVLLRTFGLGVFITLPASMLEIGQTALTDPLHLSALPASLNSAFLGAALCEEVLKFAIVYGFCSRHQAFDEPMDGILYGVTASLGFATLENVLYVGQNGMTVAIVRAVLAVPGHACWGALMGYFIGQAKFGDPAQRKACLVLALVVPILLHGLYDFPLMWANAPHGDGPAPDAPLWLPLLVVYLGSRAVLYVLKQLGTEQLLVPIPQLGVPDQKPIQIAVESEGQKQNPQPQLGVWLELAIGSLLATGGGLVCFAVLFGLMLNVQEPGEARSVVVGMAIIGVLPLSAGVWLFRRGLEKRHG